MNLLNVVCQDGQKLVSTQFLPEITNNKVVLIQNALGMKQKFYTDFALYLAKNGFTVYTYDYRSIGLSKGDENIKTSKTNWKDWGQKDLTAMAEFIAASHPKADLFLIGNSYGGNCIGMSEATKHFKAFVTVGSQHGYYRLFWPRKQAMLFVLWYVLMPLFTRIYGYFPSKIFGMGESLPKQVALDWAKVCREPSWAMSIMTASESHYAAITQPLFSISIEDDLYAPERAVNRLNSDYFTNATITRKHILLKEV
jgi:predicted alpha/beta hydrolase